MSNKERTRRALAILDFIEAQPSATAVVTSSANLLTMIDLSKCYGEIRMDNDTDAHVWRWPKTPPGGWPDPDAVEAPFDEGGEF